LLRKIIINKKNKRPGSSGNTAFEKVEQEIKQNIALLTSYGREDKSNSIHTAKSATAIKELIHSFDVFLSDSELIAWAKRIGDFPEAVLTILEKNAPLTNQVLAVLGEAITNVPGSQQLLKIKNQTMIDNLFENTTGVSLRTEKEREVRQLATTEKDLTRYINQLLILSRLRNFETETEIILDNMPVTYNIEKDGLFLKGVKRGEKQGIEKGLIKTILFCDKIGMSPNEIANEFEIDIAKVLQALKAHKTVD